MVILCKFSVKSSNGLDILNCTKTATFAVQSGDLSLGMNCLLKTYYG